MTSLDFFIQAYIACALWSSPGDDDTHLDEHYDEEDIAPHTLTQIQEDCATFLNRVSDVLPDLDLSTRDLAAQAGHDFWLTRNGHGAGFWDGDWPKDEGDILTELSKEFREIDLYVGDDGKIYGD